MKPSEPPFKRVLVQSAIWLCLIASFGATPQAHAQAASRAATAKPAMTGNVQPAAALSHGLTVVVDGTRTKFSMAELKAMPQKTVKVHNGHNNMDETYSGAKLADILAKCGFVIGKTDHQQIVHSSIKAEGADKYWVIYAAIEVEPSEHNGDVIVATSLNGNTLGAEGELKLVSTEDRYPQRWVRNLTAISLKSAE